MSGNYYYVLSFNVSNPTVRAMLDRCHMLESVETMVDFKIRSRFFSGVGDAVDVANDDFFKKLKLLYPGKNEDELLDRVQNLAIYNPKYSVSSEFLQKVIEKFGGGHSGVWEDNCCATIFFCEVTQEQTDEGMVPETWMFKYEIYVVEDAIEIPLNGELFFKPVSRAEYH